ncbi:MAG: hypothetical protein PHW08_04085 [Kiritimatiellae bacterium]|nr:hypothetical protein [Kiritimatiellia bacterium]
MKTKTITIREDEWEVDYLLAMLDGITPDEFHKQRWAPRDALVMKDGSRATIYTGQPFDPEKKTIQRAFWDHDHCLACNWVLIDTQGEEHIVGYTDGYNWLCEECYRLLIKEDQLKLKK